MAGAEAGTMMLEGKILHPFFTNRQRMFSCSWRKLGSNKGIKTQRLQKKASLPITVHLTPTNMFAQPAPQQIVTPVIEGLSMSPLSRNPANTEARRIGYLIRRDNPL